MAGALARCCNLTLPCSIEGFYQESGRAGRDGLPSLSILYACNSELRDMQRLEKGHRKGAVGQMAAYALVGSFMWQRHQQAAAAGESYCCGMPRPLTDAKALERCQGSLHLNIRSGIDCFATTCRPSRVPHVRCQRKDCCLQYPSCRRKVLLRHFKEERGSCDNVHELPCDYCQHPGRICSHLSQLETILQAPGQAQVSKVIKHAPFQCYGRTLLEAPS